MSTCIVFGVRLPPEALDWPSRNQLMHVLSSTVPVVFLTVTSSTSALIDRTRPTTRQLAANTFAIENAFAMRSHRLGRRVPEAASRLDGRWYRRALQELGFTRPIFWLTTADPALAMGLPADRLVYDCMDPNFLPLDQVRFDRAERSLARKASVVFASAHTLLARMASVNPNSYLLPNACMSSDIAEGPAPRLRPSKKVIGYLGTIDWRFDPGPVAKAARALPSARFVIAGRVNADQERRVAALRSLPNVEFPGQVDNEEGSRLIRTFDVGLIPFRPGPMNDAINPVKMHMYHALGLPVVSTWIAECRFSPHVTATRSEADFADAVVRAASKPDDGARLDRISHARRNTWEQRADNVLATFDRHGLLSPDFAGTSTRSVA